jgi:hypothetical protein
MMLLHFQRAVPRAAAPPPPQLLLDLFGRDGRKMMFTESMPVTSRLYEAREFTDENWMETVRSSIVEVLTQQCGLQVEDFSSKHGDEVYFKVSGSDARLLEQAELTLYKLRLKEELEPMEQYRDLRAFLPYSEALSSIFETNEGKFLQDIDRIRLLDSIIRDSMSRG